MTLSKTSDMTQGNITKQIIFFSAPIIFGNIFQQLYNTADAMIVGRIIGKNAFSAISVANTIVSVVLFFLVGLCIGVSVLLAQYYGAKKFDMLKKQLSTALIAGIVFTIFLSIICIIFSEKMLIVANTPYEILEDTDNYLKIIFKGLIFSFLYNFYASAMRAIGDSKAPFIYLVIAVIINIILDFVFIKYIKFGVLGAAYATVISQAIAAIMCILYVYRKVDVLKLKKNEFTFNTGILKMTIAFSWAAALQQIVLYLGRMLVQSTINAKGTDMISGYNAAIRIESFYMAFIDGTAAAISAFVGQNLGAKKTQRIKEGFFKALKINLIFSIICACIFISVPNLLVSLYISSGDISVIHIGSTYIRFIAVFYIPCSIVSILQGFFRGVGKIKVAMSATITQIIVRVILSFILVPKYGIIGVCFSLISGWICIMIFNFYQYKKYFDKFNNSVFTE